MPIISTAKVRHGCLATVEGLKATPGPSAHWRLKAPRSLEPAPSGPGTPTSISRGGTVNVISHPLVEAGACHWHLRQPDSRGGRYYFTSIHTQHHRLRTPAGSDGAAALDSSMTRELPGPCRVQVWQLCDAVPGGSLLPDWVFKSRWRRPQLHLHQISFGSASLCNAENSTPLGSRSSPPVWHILRVAISSGPTTAITVSFGSCHNDRPPPAMEMLPPSHPGPAVSADGRTGDTAANQRARVSPHANLD